MLFTTRTETGDLMSRQTGDMDAIRHFVAYVIYVTYEYVLYFVIALIMIFATKSENGSLHGARAPAYGTYHIFSGKEC